MAIENYSSDKYSDLAPLEGSRMAESAPLAHVVLYQPEIPQNTGNIGRSCVGFGAQLWIVRPTGFQLDDRSLRRAGLDYWQHLVWHDVPDWNTLLKRLEGKTMWYFSRFAERSYWEVHFERGDVLIFGSETTGLPPAIREKAGDHALRIPTPGPVRSLNLACSVGIVLAEVARQASLPREKASQPSPPISKISP